MAPPDNVKKPKKPSQDDASFVDLNPAKVSRNENEDSGCIDGLEDNSQHDDDVSQTETDLSICLSDDFFDADQGLDADASGRNQENSTESFPGIPQEQSTPYSNTSPISSSSMGSPNTFEIYTYLVLFVLK